MPEHTPAPTANRAVYGFAMYFGFKLIFIVYVIWAYVPEAWLEWLGITCLPRKYWALAIPVFLLTVLTVFAFFIYPGLGLCMNPGFNDIRTVIDGRSRQNSNKSESCSSNVGETVCSCVHKKDCFKRQYDEVKHTYPARRIPLLHDLDVVDVSEYLYFK